MDKTLLILLVLKSPFQFVLSGSYTVITHGSNDMISRVLLIEIVGVCFCFLLATLAAAQSPQQKIKILPRQSGTSATSSILQNSFVKLCFLLF